jgi:hypothetical protein
MMAVAVAFVLFAVPVGILARSTFLSVGISQGRSKAASQGESGRRAVAETIA